MRVAAEERGLNSPAIFMRLAALNMAGAPTGQEADALGIPRGAKLLDGAANNIRQLRRAATRNRGYELTIEDQLMLLDVLGALKNLNERFAEHQRDATNRKYFLNF